MLIRYVSKFSFEAIAIGAIMAFFAPVASMFINTLLEAPYFSQDAADLTMYCALCFTAAFMTHIVCELSGLNCYYLTNSAANDQCEKHY